MKKQIVICSLFAFIVINIVLLNNYVFNDNKLDEELVEYAITVDGEIKSIFPTDGNYNVSIDCDNANASWDYKVNGIKFSSISGPSTCNIDFTSRVTGTTFANRIISLRGGIDGTNDLYYTNNAEYRYSGLSPDNYVYYNDSLWRVIGVFDEETHGITGQNLVKIISEETYSYIYDEDNHSWENSNLNNIYNNYFFNSTDGSGSEFCTNCDFTHSGLDEESRKMVQTATWHLRGNGGETISELYQLERYTGNSWYGPESTQTNIGLMYLSDYGYASPSSCWNLSFYNNNNGNECSGNNWLLKNYHEFTISPPFFYESYSYCIAFDGSVPDVLIEPHCSVFGPYNSRPVLYLKSDVEYVSGTGSKSNPFIIRY